MTMGSFKDFDKKVPPMGAQASGQRKNDEESGEPIQLPDDKSKQPQGKPGMGQRDGKHGGQHSGDQQHQGGQQSGDNHEGGTANR
jgi:hypothetical protein